MLTCFKPPCFKTTMLQNHHASNHHASSSWPMSKVTYKKTQIPTHANRAHAIVLHLHTVRLQICSWPMDPRPLPWQGAWGQSWYVGMQAALLALRGMLLPPVLSYALRRLSLGFARSWDVPQPTPLLMGVFLFVRSAMREYTCLWHTHTHLCFQRAGHEKATRTWSAQLHVACTRGTFRQQACVTRASVWNLLEAKLQEGASAMGTLAGACAAFK